MSEQCPNCKAELHGPFCYACGQNQKTIDRHFFALVGEALEDVLTPSSKTARTLGAICFKPGYLTRQYFSGRRARYILPVRLYFITSITFFFMASVLLTTTTTSVDPNAEPIDIDNNITINAEDAGTDTISINWGLLSEENSKAFNAYMDQQIKKAVDLVQNDPGQAQEKLLDAAPPLIFCLLPIFALLLKLAYIGSGRFYTEHLVLALHNHSFIFIALLVENLIDLAPPGSVRDWLTTPIEIWTPLYLLLSLKVTYQQGWTKTILKFLFLGLSYSMLFFMAGALTLLVGVVFL